MSAVPGVEFEHHLAHGRRDAITEADFAEYVPAYQEPGDRLRGPRVRSLRAEERPELLAELVSDFMSGRESALPPVSSLPRSVPKPTNKE